MVQFSINIYSLEQIYGIAFIVDEKIYANSVFLLPKGVKIGDNVTVETFIKIASITLKRIKAEQNEEKFWTLFEYMPQVAFIQSGNGRITDTNKAFLDIFGLSRKDLTNLHPTQGGYPGWDIYDKSGKLLSQDDIPAFQALKTGKPVFNRIVKIKNTRTNTTKWADVTAIPKFNYKNKTPYQVFVTMHDITKAVESELKIYNFQQYLDMLLSNTPAVIYTYKTNKNGEPKITYINNNIKEILGYEPNEFFDNIDFWKSCVHHEDLPKLQNKIAGNEFEHEYRFKDKRGKFRWLFDRQKILRKDGDTIEIIGTWWDITGRKESEDLLHYLKEMQKILITLANEFINVQPGKVDHAIMEMLEVVGIFTGVDRVYVFQHDFQKQVTSITHEWCAEGITPQKDNMQDFPLKMGLTIMEAHSKREVIYYPQVSKMAKEDPIRSVLEQQNIKAIILIPLLQEGANIGFVGFDMVKIIRHFTVEEINLLKIVSEIVTNALLRKKKYIELQKSELRYRSLFDQSNDAVFILDLNGRLLAANKRASKMLGYTEKEIINLSVSEISAEPERSHQKLKQLKSGEIVPPYERKFIRKDRQIIDVEINVELIRDENGNPMHIQSIVRDISDRKMDEKALVAAKEKAQKAEEAKSVFLATVSHEIRNPLNAILGYSEILSEKLNEGKQKEMVEIINSSGNHLLSIVNEVLDWSKIEADQTVLENNPVNMPAMFDELYLMFQEKADKKGLDFVWNVASDFPESVLADVVRTKQVLINLIGNAIKFTENGEVSVSFSFEETGSTSGNLHIEIKDSGCGIAKNDQQRIFKPFIQLSNQANKNLKGTGLGLPITKKIIEKMNGRLLLESNVGEGSVFKIFIPEVAIVQHK